MSPAEVLQTIVRYCDAGRRVAWCTIVATRGSAPQPPGTMACVDEAAHLTGTLGGGCMEASVRRDAHALLTTDRSRLLTFALDNDFGHDDGMICGGHIDVAVAILREPPDVEMVRTAVERVQAGEPATVSVQVESADGPVEYRVNLEAVPRLVIAGGGHIAKVLAELAIGVGFDVTVIDDRSEFVNMKRFPPPIRQVAGEIGPTLRDWPIDRNTYLVIVTRGHKHDEEALAAVLDSPAKYIGMIGSRRKIGVVFEDLRHAGASEVHLGRVHTPIGLEIHAVTTEEIALSIAAELVSIRRSDHRTAVAGPFPVARKSG